MLGLCLCRLGSFDNYEYSHNLMSRNHLFFVKLIISYSAHSNPL